MVVVSFTALHYGLPFLREALLSVAPAVDRFVVAYSPVFSHGHAGNGLRCPDTEGDLYAAAMDVVCATGKPVQWYTEDWRHEGEQRDSVYRRAPDADVVVVVDADEVYADGSALRVAELAAAGQARQYHVSFLHHWQSFRWVCLDGAWPVRAINTRKADGEMYINGAQIHHFGYALPTRYMEYKWSGHGHKAEMSKERWADWFARYCAWTPDTQDDDCHPVSRDYWTPEPYSGPLPSVLRGHPYETMEVIR